MRIVLDKNILARAVTGPAGPAAKLVRSLGTDHLLIVSPLLVSELIRVLGYERLRRIHGLDDAGIARFASAIQEQALVVQPALPVGRFVPHDPLDDPIIAVVLDGRPHVLCTLDRHFHHPDVLALCARHSLRVLSDAQLLGELRGEGRRIGA